MSPVDAKLGREVLRSFEKRGYRPILVGGLAIEIAGFGGTKDVDLFVREAEFGGTEYLKGEGIAIISTTGGWVTNGKLTLPDGTAVPFDVLNPSKYVGNGHTGAEFYEWVAKEGSRPTPFGRVALPVVVYYTRLLVSGPHGEVYLERIRRDLGEGAPNAWLEDTLSLGRKFGTEERIRRKLERFQKLIRETDLPTQRGVRPTPRKRSRTGR